jgi:hypothetical protein
MLELLLIGVALCVALIMVAALVVIARRRRSSGQAPVPAGGRGTAAELAGEAMVPRGISFVPGFSDTVQPDRGTRVPAQRGQVAPSQARPVVGAAPDPHGPGTWPDGQRATAGAVTTSEQIASYYDQIDRPMADYLAALGWTQQPSHNPESPVRSSARQDPPPSGDHRQ